MNRQSEKTFIPVCEPVLAGNEKKYILDAIESGWISSNGKYISAFEEAFSAYSDMKYGVAVCNGTVALHLALTALGIGKGDEVIIPAFTMIATAFAVCYVGAKPVFVDVDNKTWNIDINKIEEKITSKTKAIIPVHIFGNPCDMNAIMDIASKHKLFIVEDAAEAHGSEYDGKKIGSFSSISCFSFYANKNLTTGEGGIVLMNDEKYYNLCKYYKNMCFSVNGPRDYYHDDIGFNYRMSNLHAAIGLAQVEKADYYRELRINNNKRYKNILEKCKGIIFQEDEKRALNVHWMNAIVVEPEVYGHTRDELVKYLRQNNVDSRLLFKSMSRQKALQKYGCDVNDTYPVTDYLSENGFYLPSSSSLTDDQIAYICELIRSFK